MVSNAKIKLIQSLGQKKYRTRNSLFIGEGNKIVQSFIRSPEWKVREIFAKPEWISKLTLEEKKKLDHIQEVSYEELKKISFLKTPHNVLALIEIPEEKYPSIPETGQWSFALDTVQDPGNLGTILRIAAWFGIKTVICSERSADVFNPKVIQATMGALTQVHIYYTDLSGWLQQAVQKEIPVYGAVLDGKNLFQETISRKGIIFLGNESKGIDQKYRSFITHPLTIPGAEDSGIQINSLNLSAAAAILAANLTHSL